MKVEVLKPPLSIDTVRDGCVFETPSFGLERTNLFFRVGSRDSLFVKIPSERGIGDHRTFFINRMLTGAEDVRQLEEAEFFESLDRVLETGPERLAHLPLEREAIHYLAVHWLQYQRLLKQTAIGVPQARFGAWRSSRWRFFHDLEPALFQERIAGTTLWDMYDRSTESVDHRWRPFLPRISWQLADLMQSGTLNHIDWNPRNFVFQVSTGRLFYVDMKPTVFISKSTNDSNFSEIRRLFRV